MNGVEPMRQNDSTVPGAPNPERDEQSKPAVLYKRVGSTTFEVAVHFSKTSTETMNDKILRLVKSDAEEGAAVV